MANLPRIADALRDVLTDTANRLARASGFLHRQRKLTAATFVQTLVFGWLGDPDASLERLARTAAALGCPVAAQSLDARFTEAAAGLLEGVLAQAAGVLVCGTAVTQGLLSRFDGVYLLDTTVVALPAEMQARWPGVGGNTPAAGLAALKVEVRLDLCGGELAAHLMTGRAHDQAGARVAEPLPAGALSVADLGYFSLARFGDIDASGGFWLSRFKARTVISDADGTRLSLAPLLGGTPVEVWLGATRQARCWLLSRAVRPEVADARRRKLHRAARMKGRTPSKAQLALCGWTVLVTNAPPSRLSSAGAFALYRARWQVELLFKRWKSLCGVGRSRSANPWRQTCEVYAKLLAGLVTHWVTAVGLWHEAHRSAVKAWQVVSAHARHVAVSLGSRRSLIRALSVLIDVLQTGCRINRRRGRPNTSDRLLATKACALT